jgi:3-oxoacyl-[acyl-carrier-protein] synthase-3
MSTPQSPAKGKTTIADARKTSTPGKSWVKARAVGVGSFAGQAVMQNSVFETLVDTNDAWISKRTGIRSRHVITPTENNQNSGLRDIAIKSALAALENAKVKAIDIDLVIVATSSPDDLFGDAASVASAVGATNAAGFDLTAACSGFLYGMVTASQFLHSGAYKKVLVIGADALTRFLDWSDRGTCILFGDGAGAVVMEGTTSEDESGLLGFALHSRGEGYENLQLRFKDDYKELGNTEKSIVNRGSYGKMGMNGPEVYKFAVNAVPEVITEGLQNAGLTINDVDWLLLHQANIRIMEHASQVLGIPMSKVIVNLDEYGNTSAGSIPLALTQAVKDGRVKKGDIIACAGFGAGLSWGSAILKWGG